MKDRHTPQTNGKPQQDKLSAEIRSKIEQMKGAVERDSRLLSRFCLADGGKEKCKL